MYVRTAAAVLYPRVLLDRCGRVIDVYSVYEYVAGILPGSILYVC